MKRFKVLLGQRRFQVLATMAILLLAVSIVWASGANFTATSANPSNVFSAGTMSLGNSKTDALGVDHAILTASKMMPGDTATGNVTIQNIADGSGLITLTMDAPVDSVNAPGTVGLSGALDLTITDDTTGVQIFPTAPLTKAPLTSFPAAGINCGLFGANVAHDYTFTVEFRDSDLSSGTNGSDNKYKNCGTTVTFNWEAVTQ